MKQKAFKRILERYLQHSCTAEEEALVEAWFARISTGEGKAMSDEEERMLFDIYKKDFRSIFSRKEVRTFSVSSQRYLWIKLAATVLIVLGPLLYIHVFQDQVTKNSPGEIAASVLKKAINTRSSAYPILLSDGSEVVLNPGAILMFKSPFENGNREVILEGEAFFRVTKDPQSPFIVKTGQVVTRVLGTSFSVKANKRDKNIIVTVKTGKVSVEEVSFGSGEGRKSEILTPNQQAIYDIHERSISRKELEGLEISGRPDTMQRQRFHEAPISEILRAVEKTYQTRIIFEESSFNGCLLSTSIFADEDVFERLDIICKAIGATYRIDGVSVIVSGKSCN